MIGVSYATLTERILMDLETEMKAARQEQIEIAPIFWEIVDYQFGWDLGPDQDDLYRKVSGKKARPVLMALVAQALRGDYHPVLAAGTALEFVHNFTLIHDDVMDHSPERRHRPAVWTQWGSWQAINAGDGLYALAILASTRLITQGIAPDKVVRVIQILSQACMWTAEGQILDMDFENRERVSTDDYITMITHKSGKLIEAAAKIGALLSTDDEPVIEAYGRFARHLGIAFQIRDDYLGAWGDEAKTGKSATSDIREKKKAYPVLAAYECAAKSDRAALRALYDQPTLSDEDVQAVLAIMERAGAKERTDQIARQYYTLALNDLAMTGVENEAQDAIREFAAFLVERAY